MNKLIFLLPILLLAGACTSERIYYPKEKVVIEDELSFTQVPPIYLEEDGSIIWEDGSTIYFTSATTTPGSRGCDYNVYGNLVRDFGNDCSATMEIDQETSNQKIVEWEEYNRRIEEYNTVHGFFGKP